MAFSDDGTILYAATATTVFSINDAGEESTFNWYKEVDDTDLCDIAVNGMSVRVISHIRMNVLKTNCVFVFRNIVSGTHDHEWKFTECLFVAYVVTDA